jgi:CBS domain-containing protein
MKPIGVVTDRDITCRAVAQGRNPLGMTARDVMSSPALTVRADSDDESVYRVMEDKQVRRVLVVDQTGRLCGIVAQADLALRGPREAAAEVVSEVSRPASQPSRART